MACFPAILAFSSHGWTSISCTVFVSTPETAIEFEFEFLRVCRWYLALGVVLALICTGAVWSVQALAGIWFLLSPHRVYTPSLVSLCNCLHLCLCAFVCFSLVINLLKSERVSLGNGILSDCLISVRIPTCPDGFPLWMQGHSRCRQQVFGP